jgi:hypothetical protein
MIACSAEVCDKGNSSVPLSSPGDKPVSGANITRDLLEPTRTRQPRVSFKTIANRIAPHKNSISCDNVAPYPTRRSKTHEYYSGQQGPIYKTEVTLHHKRGTLLQDTDIIRTIFDERFKQAAGKLINTNLCTHNCFFVLLNIHHIAKYSRTRL